MSSVSAVAGDAHDAAATVAFVDADAVAVAPLVAVGTDVAVVAVAVFCAVAVTLPQAARRPTIKARRRARIGSMIRLLSKRALWAG